MKTRLKFENRILFSRQFGEIINIAPVGEPQHEISKVVWWSGVAPVAHFTQNGPVMSECLAAGRRRPESSLTKKRLLQDSNQGPLVSQSRGLPLGKTIVTPKKNILNRWFYVVFANI